MVRRMLAGVVAMLVVGGIGQAAPVTDPGVIVVTGENLSGDWDFKGTVLVKSPADDPTIPDFFSGAFTVSGGDPTYSGSGTFNGSPASIEGVNATADPFTTTITLSNHITTEDGSTTFNGTLTSGDFITGIFRGGTVDGLKSWMGTFFITIKRPPTQSPSERMQSAFAAFQTNMNATVEMALSSIDATVEAAQTALHDAATDAERRAIRRDAHRSIERQKIAAFREIEEAFASGRLTLRAILTDAGTHITPALRRLVGDLSGLLGRELSVLKTRLNEGIQVALGRLLFVLEKCKIKIKIDGVGLDTIGHVKEDGTIDENVVFVSAFNVSIQRGELNSITVAYSVVADINFLGVHQEEPEPIWGPHFNPIAGAPAPPVPPGQHDVRVVDNMEIMVPPNTLQDLCDAYKRTLAVPGLVILKTFVRVSVHATGSNAAGIPCHETEVKMSEIDLAALCAGK